jgi:hypothetical protein
MATGIKQARARREAGQGSVGRYVAASSLLAASLFMGGCAHDAADRRIPLCPNSQNVPCLTPPVCQYDPILRCDACRCNSPPYVAPPRTEPGPPK